KIPLDGTLSDYNWENWICLTLLMIQQIQNCRYDAQRMNKVSIPGTQFGQNYWRAKSCSLSSAKSIHDRVRGNTGTSCMLIHINQISNRRRWVGEDGAKNDEDLSMTILQEDYVHTELDLPEENSQILAGNIVSQLDQSFKMINSQGNKSKNDD
ncbi:unnamed protein product, partial [Trichogramma brassicae]